MATFDQRHQQVTYQFNAAGNIDLRGAQNRADVVRELRLLNEEVGRAAEAQVIESGAALDAQYHLSKAVDQAQKPEPDKHSIATSLERATEVISALPAATGALSGLVNALAQAAQLVQLRF